MTFFVRQMVSDNSATGRISAPSAAITPKMQVYQHQVRM